MNRPFFTVTLVFLVLTVTMPSNLLGQDSEKEKIILITLDGFRWQELFTGADSALIANKKYVSDSTSLKKNFGG